MMDILGYTFFQHALVGSFFISVVCGIVGSYIMARRLVFISGGLTHASFGGLGLGFYLGINPIYSALGFSILSAFGIQWMSKKGNVRQDSAIGAFWALGMALGIIFMFLTPGVTSDLSAYLFGSVLLITQQDIIFAGILAVLLTIGCLLYFKPVLYTAFDREFAQAKGLPVARIENIMMIIIAISIVASIRLIGIMLLMSMLTIPQMTANLFSSRLKNIILLSIFFGIIACFMGLLITASFNIPSGACIVLVQVLLFFLLKLIFSIPYFKGIKKGAA